MVAAAKKRAASCKSVRSALVPSSARRPKSFSPTASSALSLSSKAHSAATTPTARGNYPPPPDLSLANFDWDTWQGDATKRPWDPDTSPKYFARWRCWKEYGTGVAGDLLVHLVSGMIFMLGWNEPPKRAMALGDILRFKDGRNMPDVHATLFDYGRAPVIFASISAARRRRFTASRAPRASSKSPRTTSPILRNPAKTNLRALTLPAILRPFAKPT